MPKHKHGPGKKRDRKYQHYCAADLKKALAAMKKGATARAAGEQYNIPHATLSRKAKRTHMNPVGRPTVFSEEETKLSECLMKCAEWGFPLMVVDIQLVVQSFLYAQGRKEIRFKNNCPGPDWARLYLERHNELSHRLCQNVKRARACISEDTIHAYFDELSVTLAGVKPAAIVNYDESGFTGDPGQQLVVVRRGTKHAERIIDTSRETTSVMFSGAGDGTSLPQYIVYKAKHLYPGWLEREAVRGRFTTELRMVRHGNLRGLVCEGSITLSKKKTRRQESSIWRQFGKSYITSSYFSL